MNPKIQFHVRRVPSRQIPFEVLERNLDFGVLTFQPSQRDLQSITIGDDELVMLTHP